MGLALGRVALALGLLLALSVAPGAARARPAPDGFADLVQKLLPAVVNVSSVQTVAEATPEGKGPEHFQVPPGSPFEDFFKDFMKRRPDLQPRRTTSLGSGFIIDPAGYIVTNNHVIADADQISVILHDNTSLKATVVGRDTKTDIALLKVDAGHPLPALTWGDSGASRVGDWVLAIGNPFGLGGTVTAGIISAQARDIDSGPYDDFIQTDAPINRGNSGGPLFNMQGQVIGINTAIFSPSGGSIGIGFAVPSSLAQRVVDQLRRWGHTRRGWLGVRIQEVTPDIAETLALPKAQGALVASVTPKGPAESGGIQSGDVILTFDGQTVSRMRSLPRLVADTDIGRKVPVTVWRHGKDVALFVTVGELKEAPQAAEAPTTSPSQPAPAQPVDVLGLSLSKLTPDLRARFEIKSSAKGVLIVDVDPASEAAEKGVRPGDLITEVSQVEVKTPADVVAKVAQARQAGRKRILFTLEGDSGYKFVPLSLNSN